MQMNRLSTASIVALFVAGCASERSPQGAQKPPEHADRVQVAMYDSSPRAKLEHIDVFDETQSIQRPHKIIALLTCEGRVDEEGVMTEALIYRARMMGADAVMILPPYVYRDAPRPPYHGSSTRKVYRAKAAVYEQSSK
jgi:hypothetical protein